MRATHEAARRRSSLHGATSIFLYSQGKRSSYLILGVSVLRNSVSGTCQKLGKSLMRARISCVRLATSTRKDLLC